MKLKLISDGTNVGTKLIDENTGEMVHGIQKITWHANANELRATLSIDLINIPVEIQSNAQIEEFSSTDLTSRSDMIVTDVKITQLSDNMSISDIKVVYQSIQEVIGGIYDVSWEATPEKISTNIKKYKFS